MKDSYQSLIFVKSGNLVLIDGFICTWLDCENRALWDHEAPTLLELLDPEIYQFKVRSSLCVNSSLELM